MNLRDLKTIDIKAPVDRFTKEETVRAAKQLFMQTVVPMKKVDVVQEKVHVECTDRK